MRGRVITVVVLIAALGLGCAARAAAREVWGPFRGTVVDMETREPIAGAVVLVVWWELYGVGFIGQRFYEAREAVTDAEGRFEVPRLGAQLWKLGVQPPWFHIFTPGYQREREIVTPPDGERFVAPTVVPMKRLKTREERRRYMLGRFPAGVPHEKAPQFLGVLNKELSALGMGTYSVGGPE